jgi:hypothetical protein
MPDDDSQLELKHVAMNKLIKTGDVCDWFDTYTCNCKSSLFITLQGTEFLDIVYCPLFKSTNIYCNTSETVSTSVIA